MKLVLALLLFYPVSGDAIIGGALFRGVKQIKSVKQLRGIKQSDNLIKDFSPHSKNLSTLKSQEQEVDKIIKRAHFRKASPDLRDLINIDINAPDTSIAEDYTPSYKGFYSVKHIQPRRIGEWRDVNIKTLKMECKWTNEHEKLCRTKQ